MKNSKKVSIPKTGKQTQRNDYSQIPKDIIGRTIERLGLKGRKAYTQKFYGYFLGYTGVKKDTFKSSWCRQTDKYKEKSPLHYKLSTEHLRRRAETKFRQLIYSIILVAIEQGVFKGVNEIPYSELKERGFDLFPTKLHFVPSVCHKKAKITFSLSFWDFVSGDPAVYECGNGVGYDYPNIDVIKEYCSAQRFSDDCMLIYMRRLKNFPLVIKHIYSKAGVNLTTKQACVLGVAPVLYKVEHEGFSKEIMEQNLELYKGLIESALWHYGASRGKGYVVKKPTLPEEIEKEWVIFKRSIIEHHSKIMENFMRVASLTFNDLTKQKDI